MKTTLNAIKANGPCTEGYRKLLTFLGKRRADNDPLELSTVLESNGYDDTVWCFRAVSGYDTELRLFAVFCAKQVQHLITDHRSINCIDVSERYAMGQATDAELQTACDAAACAHAAYTAARNTAAYTAAAYYAAAYTAARAAHDAANYSTHYACVADPEIQSVSEAYLKELLSVK